MGKLLADKYQQWTQECEQRFRKLKANEEELNRIFIRIYGLQNDVSPEVKDGEITVHKADLQREIKSLLSYAVGCMFGRYSPDTDGLIYAGGVWDENRYRVFHPVQDNIIPLCGTFKNGIITELNAFLAAVYGEDTLLENLKFIASALGGEGSPADVIQDYFLSEFFSDHCRVYQKKPIYWLFSSGKNGAFKGLTYLHRYTPGTLTSLLNDYIIPLQMQYRMKPGLNLKLSELEKYRLKVSEIEKQNITLSLDDGICENYKKIQRILEEIK